MPLYLTLPLTILALLFVASGVVHLRRTRRLWFVGGGNGVLNRMYEHKAILLRALKDLDNEHETGKIDDQTHATRRQELMAEAAQINASIDQAKGVIERVRQQVAKQRKPAA